jgi:hypothetical protein
MSKMKASVFEEAESKGKYVIFRGRGGWLNYVEEEHWDDYRAKRGDRLTATEVSRGHTLVEAINLTELGSEDE